MNQALSVIQIPQQSALAGVLPVHHVFDGHYRKFENPKVSSPDRRWSRIDPVEVLAPNRSDQSLYEGVRKRHVRNSLDFGYLEYPKIGLPLVESIQRIMIGAEVFR